MLTRIQILTVWETPVTGIFDSTYYGGLQCSSVHGIQRKLKELLTSGVVGDIVSVQHLEPVGYWHHAHSFVRGNWRNSMESSFMLLAKSRHDMDWLRFVINKHL